MRCKNYFILIAIKGTLYAIELLAKITRVCPAVRCRPNLASERGDDGRRTTDDDASTNDDDGGDGNPSSGALRRMGTRRDDDGDGDDARCRDGSVCKKRVRTDAVERVSKHRGGDDDDERGADGSSRRVVDASGANGGEARVEEGE